ncbi:hypothetical protein JB92DRAFT_3148162 [Gautieria morchelliformis]|nr:hypothetical protein JB92DRAFT_3148162 [Gautieria morchelliformis]
MQELYSDYLSNPVAHVALRAMRVNSVFTLNVNTAFKLIKPNTSTSKPTPISTCASSTDPAMELGPLRWPHEFFFIDIVDGLVLYDIKVKQGKHQQTAFVKIFGVPCVHQTLLNKCQLLEEIKQNNEELYDMYLMKGQVDEARWAHLESVAEGKPLRGKKWLDLLRSVTRNRRILDTSQDVESEDELDRVMSKINANIEGCCPICTMNYQTLFPFEFSACLTFTLGTSMVLPLATITLKNTLS